MKLYIAGPITIGRKLDNLRNAIEAAEQAVRRGWEPYVPHLNMVWELFFEHPHAWWMDLDRPWLRVCDAILRLPGESRGADEEVRLAIEAGKPIFWGLAELPDRAAEVTHAG